MRAIDLIGSSARLILVSAGALAFASAGPSSVTAQGTLDSTIAPTSAPYVVEVLAGRQSFEKSALLQSTGTFGLRIGRPVFGKRLNLGIAFSMGQPTTRGEYFPWNRQVYFSDAAHQNDTTLLFIMNQHTWLATYGLTGDVKLPLPILRSSDGSQRLEVLVGGGLGFTTFWLDPEQQHRSTVAGGWMHSLGAGVRIPLGGGVGFSLRAEDVVLHHYFRSRFSLSDPLFTEDLFRNPLRSPPRDKQSVHAPRIMVGFGFVPGARQP